MTQRDIPYYMASGSAYKEVEEERRGRNIWSNGVCIPKSLLHMMERFSWRWLNTCQCLRNCEGIPCFLSCAASAFPIKQSLSQHTSPFLISPHLTLSDSLVELSCWLGLNHNPQSKLVLFKFMSVFFSHGVGKKKDFCVLQKSPQRLNPWTLFSIWIVKNFVS